MKQDQTTIGQVNSFKQKSKEGIPNVLSVQLDGIPQELKDIPRWVMWKLVQRSKPNGEKVWTKMPVTVDGKAASSTNAATWTTYDDVCDALIMGEGFDGIGLVLGADVQGIDLDDCRSADGSLTELATEVLARVDGYAEVSPSGTGIKIFARTNLDGSRTKKEAGVELYRDGRYFTVTGHTIAGHAYLSSETQDLNWFIKKIWNDSLTQKTYFSDASELALANYKPQLENWDLERVVNEVLPNLDPDMGYSDWIKVGMALKHQGDGDLQWLDAWDNWSSGSGKWIEGECFDKWTSFSVQRLRGNGATTLASVLADVKKTKNVIPGLHNRSNFSLIPVDELISKPPEVRFLIDQMLEENSLCLFVGESQTYKSFCAIDTSACIATGTNWHGRETLKGSVIYIAGEGHNGLSRRLKAWEIQKGVSLANAPLHFSSAPIAMMDSENMKSVSAAVEATIAKYGLPKLIVIDTVHRNFGAGDENGTKDWAIIFHQLDAMRTRYGCTILLVHHTGHTASDRARGSSSLRAGLDFEFLFSRTSGNNIKVECKKSKDAEPPLPIGFESVTIKLPWHDKKGQQMTSVVLREIPIPKFQPKPLSGAKRIALEALRRLLKTATLEASEGTLPEAWIDLATWRDAALADGLSDANDIASREKAFRRARKELLDARLVSCLNDQYTTT